jgi:site-specific DNA-methyltransferase (adenine-specific)
MLVGDCVEVMRGLPSKSARLIIADPPYNLAKNFGVWRETAEAHRWLPWCKEWLQECQRLLADDGSIFVYGIHHHLCWIQCHMYEMGLKYRRQIIWHYENGFAGYTRSLAAHYEPLLWFSKGDSYVYHPIREPYRSVDRLKYKVTKNGKTWRPNPEGRLAGDVWRFPVLAGKRFAKERVAHPTQKPLSISSRIVEHFSDPGDLVLVPFAGSGSECVAAQLLGRRYLGIELNPDYVAIAEQRLLSAPGLVSSEIAAPASGPTSRSRKVRRTREAE